MNAYNCFSNNKIFFIITLVNYKYIVYKLFYLLLLKLELIILYYYETSYIRNIMQLKLTSYINLFIK